MQPIGVWKNDGLGSHGRPGLRFLGRGGAVERQRENRRFADDRGSGAIGGSRDDFAVRDDHFGQETLGVGGNIVQVELDERRARVDLVSHLGSRCKSPALQRNGVDSYVHEHFDAARRLESHRMAGCVPLQDLAWTRRSKDVVGGVDRDPVTGKFL